MSAFERDRHIILANRPEHTQGRVTGSTFGKCDDCGHTVWLAPSSRRILAEAPAHVLTGVTCCCCANVHGVVDMLVPHPKYGTLHTHHWAHGRCMCGMDKAEFEAELRGTIDRD